MRITKVYTRTGDAGKTRLAGGQQVWVRFAPCRQFVAAKAKLAFHFFERKLVFPYERGQELQIDIQNFQ